MAHGGSYSQATPLGAVAVINKGSLRSGEASQLRPQSTLQALIKLQGGGSGWGGVLNPLYMSLADADRNQITPPVSHGLWLCQAPVGIPHPSGLAKIVCREKISSLVFPDLKRITGPQKPFLIQVRSKPTSPWLGPARWPTTGPPKLSRS